MENSKSESSVKFSVVKVLGEVAGDLYSEKKSVLILIAINMILSVLINLFPVFFQKILFRDISGGNIDIKKIVMETGIFTGIMISASMVIFYSQSYFSYKFEIVANSQILKILKKIYRMDYYHLENSDFLDELDVAFHAFDNTEGGYRYILKSIPSVIPQVISIIILTLLLLNADVLIPAGILINGLCIVLINSRINKLIYSKRNELSHARRTSYYLSFTANDFKYSKDIRIFSLKDKILRVFREQLDNLFNINRYIKNREFFWGILSSVSTALSLGLIYGVLIFHGLNGMTIDNFSMYFMAATSLNILFITFFKDLSKVRMEARYVHDTKQFIRKNYGELSSDAQKDEVKIPGNISVEFKDVSFKYPGTDRLIFENLNLEIQKGERIALIGVNGAGKSTLIKLLTGFFRPDSGEILINGKSLESFSKRSLYSLFSPIFQDVYILPFDIKRNIMINDEETPENIGRVWDSLQSVGMKDKIMSFKDKLSQKVNKAVYDDAAELSGGQEQKLGIARALYKDGNMFLMDEPTASLDALAEQKIYMDLNSLLKDKTIIFVSHRLSSTRFCDRIVVLNGSHIEEEGTHESLLEKKGLYYEMFLTQGKYYQEAN